MIDNGRSWMMTDWMIDWWLDYDYKICHNSIVSGLYRPTGLLFFYFLDLFLLGKLRRVNRFYQLFRICRTWHKEQLPRHFRAWLDCLTPLKLCVAEVCALGMVLVPSKPMRKCQRTGTSKWVWRDWSSSSENAYDKHTNIYPYSIEIQLKPCINGNCGMDRRFYRLALHAWINYNVFYPG